MRDPQPGTVTQVTPVFRVQLDTASTPSSARRLASYGTPLIGDRVAVVPFDQTVLVLGKVV